MRRALICYGRRYTHSTTCADTLGQNLVYVLGSGQRGNASWKNIKELDVGNWAGSVGSGMELALRLLEKVITLPNLPEILLLLPLLILPLADATSWMRTISIRQSRSPE